MCTMIVNQALIDGCGKGASGWFKVSEVNVSYDHPVHAAYEHAVNIDFANEAEWVGARVGVELSLESARNLIKTIQTVLDRAEAEGHLEDEPLAAAR